MTLSETITQAEFGQLVGIGQSAVSRLVTDGVLPEPLVAGPALLAYCHRLREQAAGRMGAIVGGLDLAQERAALAREQREGLAIKNAVLRGEYASVQVLAQVLAAASQAVVQRIDHLPAQLRRGCPDLPPEAIDGVMDMVASARNEWLRQTADLMTGVIDQMAGDRLEEDADSEPARDETPLLEPTPRQ